MEGSLQTGWIVAASLAALAFYAKGSRRLYQGRSPAVRWIGFGMAADLFMAGAASTRALPVLLPGESIPYGSPLFVFHIVTTSAGMLGFAAVLVAVLIAGRVRYSGWMRFLTYRVVFPVWTAGVVVATVNYFTKLFLSVNLYDII